MGKKLSGPLSREERALGREIAAVFKCDVDDAERVFDGMDGGGHYASSATYHGADWVFEASLVATPCWHGGHSRRRLGWEYELRLFSAYHSGRDADERSHALSEEFGQALLRCRAPAAMALAALPGVQEECARLREEMGELIGALALKAQIRKAAKPAKAAKKPASAL